MDNKWKTGCSYLMFISQISFRNCYQVFCGAKLDFGAKFHGIHFSRICWGHKKRTWPTINHRGQCLVGAASGLGRDMERKLFGKGSSSCSSSSSGSGRVCWEDVNYWTVREIVCWCRCAAHEVFSVQFSSVWLWVALCCCSNCLKWC